MTNMFSIVADRVTAWSRRKEWDLRNARGKRMTVFIVCPVCGPPNTKGVRAFGVAGERLHWIRLRRIDSCQCVLTPSQDAAVIRQARKEANDQDPAGD